MRLSSVVSPRPSPLARSGRRRRYSCVMNSPRWHSHSPAASRRDREPQSSDMRRCQVTAEQPEAVTCNRTVSAVVTVDTSRIDSPPPSSSSP